MPLFTLETKDADQRYGFLRGLHCSMKMSFTSILDMLELAGIPLKSTDRSEVDPIIIAGDPAPFNPEPLAEFIDVFFNWGR